MREQSSIKAARVGSGAYERRCAVLSDVGRKRKANEDAFLVDDGNGLFLVADGMGGRSAGEVASRLVVDTVERTLRGLTCTDDLKAVMTPLPEFSEPANRLVYSVLVANKRTFEHAQTHPECKGMGSTLSAVLVADRRLVVCNVGDSPVYLIRGGVVETLSTPHTVLAEQESLPEESSRQIGKHYLHMITRAMGVGQTVQPDVKEVSFQPGDTVVLCSDGLSDKTFPDEIAEIVGEHAPESACKALVDLANERGGDDNITVVVVKFDPSRVAAISLRSSEDVRPAPPPMRDGSGLVVEYDTDDASYTAICRRLGMDGIFMETREPFKEGEILLLNITDPQTEETVMVSGVVAGRTVEGVDIAFEDLTPVQMESIKALTRRR